MKKKIFLLLLVFVMIAQVIIPVCNSYVVAATTSDTLIVSGGVTVTKSSTVADVTRQFGEEPRLVTPSAFGGYSYTYIKGDYECMLYIETDDSGVIVSFGAISEDFTSEHFYSYGEKDSGKVTYMQGTTITTPFVPYVIGMQTYRSDIIRDKVNPFCVEYMNHKHDYQKYYSEHSALWVNCLLKQSNCEVMTEFDEETYDALCKIDDKTTIERYAQQNNKETYIRGTNTDIGYLCLYSELPNPMRPVSYAYGHNPTQLDNKAYLVYEMYINDEGEYDGFSKGCYYNERLVEKFNEIPMTSQEKQSYNSGVQVYKDSINTFNQNGSDLYEIEPTFENLPLVAGKIYENKIIGSIGFLNAIRTCADLPTISYDKSLSEGAQNKVVLLRYMLNNGLTPSDPHYPAKPDGVDTEFYNLAQKVMNENVYGGDLISGITNAIGDGNSVQCGHRYNLLNPSFKYMGIGYADGQSVHKFSGNNICSNEVVAWPSKGVTPIEGFIGGFWTCKFQKNYTTTNNTTVQVRRLNENITWEFNEQTLSGNSRLYTSEGLISFYNPDLTGNNGQVYEITIKNVENSNTGAIENYTYRTVFSSLTGQKVLTYPSSVDIEQSEIQAGIGASVVLNTVFPEGTTEIGTSWSSSDPSVATVDQYGQVKILKGGNATITATTLNGKKATCNVTGLSSISGFDTNKEKYIIQKGKKETAELTSDVLFDPSKVEWSTGDESIASVDRLGIITANSVGKTTLTIRYGDTTITKDIKVIGEALSSPKLKVDNNIDRYGQLQNPGDEVTIYVIQEGKACTSASYSFNFDYDSTNFEIVRVEPLIDGLTYTLENGKLEFLCVAPEGDVCDYYGKIANVVIRVRNDCHYADNDITLGYVKYCYWGETQERNGTCQYITSVFTANSVASVSLSKTSHKFESFGDTITLQASVSPTEYVEDTTINWSSSNTSVATVDNNGKVTSVGNGNAVITASSNNGKSATCNIEVKVPNDFKSASFDKNEITIIKGGETQELKVTLDPVNPDDVGYIGYYIETYRTWEDEEGNLHFDIQENRELTNEIYKYIKLESNSSDRKTARVTCLDTVKDNTRAYLVAEILGKDYFTVLGYAKCNINMISPVESISIGEDMTIDKKETPTLNVEINPTGYTDTIDTTWSSSDTSLLRIDASTGKITPLRKGTANVTCTVNATNSLGKTTFKNTIAITVTSDEPDYLKGDMNNDYYINSTDAALVLDKFKYGNATSQDYQRGDMDENNILNSTDAAMILDIFKNSGN